MILNVRFQFNLPGFHIPSFSFPCIRILFIAVGNCDTPPTNDENNQPSSSSSPPSSSPTSPSTSSQSTTQSSSSCTETQTATDCQVTCSLSTMADGGTTTDCYTTVCSVTRAQCSITATTSTTILSTTITTQCPRSISNDEVSCSPDNLDCLDLDESPGPTGSGKDGPKVVGQGTRQCTLQTNALSTKITWPWVPGGRTILNDDLMAAGLYTGSTPIVTTYMQGTRTSLLRWLSATTDPINCGPSIVSITGPEFHAAEVAGSKYTFPSMDHAFEKNWLTLFLANVTDPNAQPLSNVPGQRYVVRSINCVDLHNFFFGTSQSRNAMGDLFNAMPGGDTNFLDLAGMSANLNRDAKVRYSHNSPSSVLTLILIQGAVSYLPDFIQKFEKYLNQKYRVKATNSFDDGYNKVQESLNWLQNVWLGFEALNRDDVDNLLTLTLWKAWDVL